MAGSAKDEGPAIKALEMEVLNPSGNNNNNSNNFRQQRQNNDKELFPGASEESKRIEQGIALARMYIQMNPKISMAVGGVIGILVLKWMFFRHAGQTLYVPPHLKEHFGDLESYYDVQMAHVSHWCLHGGDDDCTCEDPTDPVSRFELKSWLHVHEENKNVAEQAAKNKNLDVVFVGDDITELWNGKQLNAERSYGKQVQEIFNHTFRKEYGAPYDGIALGIAYDSTSNLFWRLINGEAPPKLNPKVWWILIGTNDLIRGKCSEEVIILGILRLADEIAMIHNDAVVVIQGLLPRSPYEDGSLKKSPTHIHSSRHHYNRDHEKQIQHYLSSRYKNETIRSNSNVTSLFSSNNNDHYYQHKEYYKKEEDLPIWPSIELINKELENFCQKHDHMVYFDAASLFLGYEGNDHYKSGDVRIIKDLMPNFAQPSVKGYEILSVVIQQELDRIIKQKKETNYRATKKDYLN